MMNAENPNEGKDEEGRSLLETVLEQVRLQREEISNLQDQIRNISQNEVISELIKRVDQIETRNTSTNSSDNPLDFLQPEAESRPSGSSVDNPQDMPIEQDIDQGVEQDVESQRRRTRGSPLSNILGRNLTNNEYLPNDVFTLMMLSRPISACWALGIIVAACQTTLITVIYLDMLAEKRLGTLDFHWMPNTTLQAGKLVSIFVVLLAQRDVFSSFRTLDWFGHNTRWDTILLGKNEDDDPPSRREWIIHILIPNKLKFVQGVFVLYVSFYLILQSGSILDLVKDFTALMIVSELGNMVFDFIAYGYLGESLQKKTVEAQVIKIKDDAQRKGGRRTSARMFLLSTIISLLALWYRYGARQKNGAYFDSNFPGCVDSSGQSYFHLALEHAQDESCYGGPLNTIQCGFEDGDCFNFNMAYPLCKGNELINAQDEIGNGVCNRLFAIPGCNYDGGDCCPLSIQNALSFGDGICHGGTANTELCGYDNGDCRDFVAKYPDCPLEENANTLRTLNLTLSSKITIILGDGICDHNSIYNNVECGFENGDCTPIYIFDPFD